MQMSLGFWVEALIDSGLQISTITKDLVEHLQLPIHILDAILNVEATVGCRVPYMGTWRCISKSQLSEHLTVMCYF